MTHDIVHDANLAGAPGDGGTNGRLIITVAHLHCLGQRGIAEVLVLLGIERLPMDEWT